MRTDIVAELVKREYRLLVAGVEESQFNRMARYLKITTPDAEIEQVSCEKEGCWEADMVILAVARNSIPGIAGKVKEVITQKLVLCISEDQNGNYFPFSEAQELQQLLPFSKVVAAFNNGQSAEMLLAGDDKESVRQVALIVESAGYLPIVAESLSTIKTL